ncbi:hypothetical protein GCM10007320_40650 [Pseudorhodoferax aquiterrae]|uniref:Uncharacterized protein n=1 Tax=Pseudorhodoferax aquiterrae TaxID=747304 RepID=A0ABQ3G5I8_9BURK|nr:hypothetical protein GCM10007320_40650 [Pseudorhodoferax aquiterrae]
MAPAGAASKASSDRQASCTCMFFSAGGVARGRRARAVRRVPWLRISWYIPDPSIDVGLGGLPRAADMPRKAGARMQPF